MSVESRKHTLLIVEDESSLRMALHDKFLREGYAVSEARDGEEGLTAALREHPDMILLDIIMPKMDGMTVLKKLREDAWGKNARVVILTNLGDSKKIETSLAQGVCEYLVKTDCKIEDIALKVNEYLRP